MRSEKSAGRRDGLTGQTGSNLLGRLKLPIMTRQAHRRPLATLEVPRYLGRLMQWGPAELPSSWAACRGHRLAPVSSIIVQVKRKTQGTLLWHIIIKDSC